MAGTMLSKVIKINAEVETKRVDHSRFRKSQKRLQIANPMTRTLLTWTAEPDLHVFLTCEVTISAEELGTMTKNNLRGITLLPYILSWSK